MFRKILFIPAIIITMAGEARAQDSQVMYYMNIPQNHLLNPALRPSNSVYVGIPALSGINISVNNNFVNFSDIFINGGKDSVITFLHPDYDINEFLSKINKRNFIAPSISYQLLGLGFTAGKDLYVSFDIIDRIEGLFVIPGDLIKLALKGNEEFIGQTIDLSNLDAGLNFYREFGLGFSKNFGKNLRIGVRPKLLLGMASVSLDNNSLSLTVNEDYSHTLITDLSAHVSGPLTVFYDEENMPDSIAFDDDYISSAKFLMNTSNTGFGIDIGATYRIGNRINVSASISDFGFIKWKDRISNLDAENHFEFSGLNITDVVNGDITMDKLAENLLDSLKNSFVLSNNTTPFTTFLPAGISLGGSFNVTKSLSLGFLSHSVISGSKFRQAATISANLNLGNALSTSLSYTAANDRFDNLGFGLAFRMAVVQMYFIADRIPITWNRIIMEEGNATVPANWNTLNLRFGINLVMGNKVNKKNDKPMLIEQN